MLLVKPITFTSFILSGIFVSPSLASETRGCDKDNFRLAIFADSGSCGDITGLSWKLYQRDSILEERVAGTYNETIYSYIEDVCFDAREGCLTFKIYNSIGDGCFYKFWINGNVEGSGGENQSYYEKCHAFLCANFGLPWLETIRVIIGDIFIMIGIVYIFGFWPLLMGIIGIILFPVLLPFAALGAVLAFIHPSLAIIVSPVGFIVAAIAAIVMAPGWIICFIGWTLSPPDLRNSIEKYISWLQEEEEKDIPLDVFFHD